QNYAEVYKQSQFIHVRIGTMFDLSSDASHFRLGVELFDENKAPITTALDSHIKSGQLKVDGNKYKMDGNVSHANFTIISEQVRYVRVLITSGNDTEIVGNVLIIEGLPVSGIKEHTQDSEQGWSLIYAHDDQEHKLAVERVAFLLSEKQTKIHIQGTIPSELRMGESIVLILTKTKKLA
ncbi:TPA: hypothetical protein ACT2HS_001478, partial [Pasteurella multocida]